MRRLDALSDDEFALERAPDGLRAGKSGREFLVGAQRELIDELRLRLLSPIAKGIVPDVISGGSHMLFALLDEVFGNFHIGRPSEDPDL